MKVFGITKVRNEEAIMKETLDHWAQFCTGGIFVLDDVSDDKTVEICESHPAVKGLFKGKNWHPNREYAEWYNRQTILEMAKLTAGPDDWFVYFDADERLYDFDFKLLFDKKIDAIAAKLFDIYITPEDVNKSHNERLYVGPEHRTIVFFFRNQPGIGYDKPDQRITNLKAGANIAINGFVKHFGKGLSVEQWEKTCDYYIEHWPKYAAKWKARKGKAVKTDMLSDFGNPLILWEERAAKGFSLEAQTYGLN